MNERPKVVITDYDYGDVDIERSILEPVGARVVALQARSESDLLEEVVDCAAVMNQYAYVGARAIERMQRCRVIARYGVGVDIVDVEEVPLAYLPGNATRIMVKAVGDLAGG